MIESCQLFFVESQKQPPEVFCKIGAFRNFANLTRKHPFQNLKPSGLQLRVFSYEFCVIFRNSFFTEHLRWLLLQSFSLSVWLNSEHTSGWKKKGCTSVVLRTFHINPSRPDLGRREEINLHFHFLTSLRCLKRFYEGVKGLYKKAF